MTREMHLYQLKKILKLNENNLYKSAKVFIFKFHQDWIEKSDPSDLESLSLGGSQGRLMGIPNTTLF